MRHRRPRPLTFGLARGLLPWALCLPGVALGQTLTAPTFTLSGFGTLGYAGLDHPDAEYRNNLARDGADENGSLELDSRLGLQLDAELTRRLSGTLQVIGREGPEGDAEAALEWAFARFLPSDTLALRLGRMPLPIFSLSDYREVGYANELLRPPEEVHAQISVRRFDGIDLTYDTELGATLLRAQIYTGQTRERILNGLEADGENTLGLSLFARRGPLRARLSHLTTRLDLDIEGGRIALVHDALVQLSPLLPELAPLVEDFADERRTLRFDAIGLTWDPPGWFVDAELARRRIDTWVPDVDTWSLTGGLRLGGLTPYALAARAREVDGDRRVTLPDGAGFDQLEAGINQFYEPTDQSTVGVGLRWDPRPRLALKVQLERISREVVGISLRRDVDDGDDAGEDVLLYSAGIDFVF